MVEVDTKEAGLKWGRYYPRFKGWNDGLDETDRWYIEIRKAPTRSSVVDISAAIMVKRQEVLAAMEKKDPKAAHAAAVEGLHDEIDGVSLLITQHTRGPFKLVLDGERPASMFDLLKVLDSQEFVDEIEGQLKSIGLLSGGERGNSPAPSGGDTPSPDGADQKEQSAESTPAAPAS